MRSIEIFRMMMIAIAIALLPVYSLACSDSIVPNGDFPQPMYQFTQSVFEERQKEAELEEEQMKTSSQMSEEERLLAESACRSEVCGCNVKIEDLGTFTATAYCGCSICSDYFGKKTASGTDCITEKTIAVDPDVIPLGSTVFVEFPDGSIRECIADDTGGAIKGNKIDIYMDKHEEAQSFGVRLVRCYLEEKDE